MSNPRRKIIIPHTKKIIDRYEYDILECISKLHERVYTNIQCSEDYYFFVLARINDWVPSKDDDPKKFYDDAILNLMQIVLMENDSMEIENIKNEKLENDLEIEYTKWLEIVDKREEEAKN